MRNNTDFESISLTLFDLFASLKSSYQQLSLITSPQWQAGRNLHFPTFTAIRFQFVRGAISDANFYTPSRMNPSFAQLRITQTIWHNCRSVVPFVVPNLISAWRLHYPHFIRRRFVASVSSRAERERSTLRALNVYDVVNEIRVLKGILIWISWYGFWVAHVRKPNQISKLKATASSAINMVGYHPSIEMRYCLSFTYVVSKHR